MDLIDEYKKSEYNVKTGYIIGYLIYSRIPFLIKGLYVFKT
jgi:hypothetical protein